MSKTKDLLSEFKEEAKSTRKYLELVPMDKSDFKPHEKNFTLGKLASHVAEIPAWFPLILNGNELNFANSDFKPFEATTNEELLKYFDDNVKRAEETLLKDFPDEEYDKTWTMRSNEKIYIQIPKSLAVRVWCLNHWYHHRAQLGVYLRLLGLPLPGIYGPTADEQEK